MICPYCNEEILNDSVFCSLCGKRLEPSSAEIVPSDTVKCPNCGNLNPQDSNYCSNCRTPLSQTALAQMKEQRELQRQQIQESMQAMTLKVEQERLQLQQQQYSSIAKCPHCGSTSLFGNKKGFGIGKAVVGAALFGPLGLAAGSIGSKKVQVTCLKCGKKFKL